MRVRTDDEKCQFEVEKTRKIVLSDEEYEKWKKIWLDTLGWNNEFPQTTSLHRIILRGNYKWHPFTDVELEIVTARNEVKGKSKTRVSKVR